MAGNQFGIHTQNIDLRLVAIRHDTGQQVGRSTGHGRKFRGDLTARATLGQGESLTTLDKHLMHLLLNRSSLKSNHIVGNNLFQGSKLTLDLLTHLAPLHLIGRKAQTHDTRSRQVGQLQILGQRLLPLFDTLGQERLGQAGRNERAVDNLTQVKASLQAGHHFILHQMLHLEGNTRQRDNHTSLVLEPHTGGGAVGVVQHRTDSRHFGLRTIQRIEGDASLGKHTLNMLSYSLIEAHLAMEKLGQGLLCDVVLRGAKATGQDNHLGALLGTTNRLHDLLAAVANRGLLAHDNAGCIELAGNRHGIGIDNLANENLIANG